MPTPPFPTEDAVDDDPLTLYTERGQLPCRTHRLGERAGLWTGHQHERRPGRIAKGCCCGLVPVTLTLEPAHGAEARGALRVLVDEPAPGGGQLEEPERMAGGRRAEDDNVGGRRLILTCKHRRELVEGCDLRRTGARELLLDAADRLVREKATHRAHDALAVGAGGVAIDGAGGAAAVVGPVVGAAYRSGVGAAVVAMATASPGRRDAEPLQASRTISSSSTTVGLRG